MSSHTERCAGLYNYLLAADVLAMKKLAFIFGICFAVLGVIVTLSLLVGAISGPGPVDHDAQNWNLFGLWLILLGPANVVAHLFDLAPTTYRQWTFLATITNAILCSLLGVFVGALAGWIFRLPSRRNEHAV
jgi:hypothetical protein